MEIKGILGFGLTGGIVFTPLSKEKKYSSALEKISLNGEIYLSRKEGKLFPSPNNIYNVALSLNFEKKTSQIEDFECVSSLVDRSEKGTQVKLLNIFDHLRLSSLVHPLMLNVSSLPAKEKDAEILIRMKTLIEEAKDLHGYSILVKK